MATVLLQARVGSTRLPGKALKEILGKPMLYYTVESLKRAPAVDAVVLVIPDIKKDDVLEAYAGELGIHCFRGSELNVLERFYRASLSFPDEHYFRATGDNPIMDMDNPGRLLEVLKRPSCGYAAESGMPLGSVVEAFTRDALERCYREAETEAHREHVTLYMKEKPNRARYGVEIFPCPEAYRYPGLRLTVDYPEDFQRAEEIIRNVYKEGIPPFSAVIDFARGKGWGR